MSDGNGVFILEGSSARTDTLVLPSTVSDMPFYFFDCVITGKNGDQIESEPAVLEVTNVNEYKPVLYVGEYAIEPGEKIDLSEKDMGTGTVEYASDGTTVTFNEARINTANYLFDKQLAPSLGILFEDRYDYQLEYHFIFNGENSIDNDFYDPDYNSAGVDLNAFFACKDDPNCPTIFFEGEGKLYLNGGSNQLYSDSNIEINIPVETHPNGDIFGDGIRANSLYIGNGVALDLNVNGTAIHTEGDLRIEDGAVINVTSSAPHVSVGPTIKNIFFVYGSIYAKKAQIKIEAFGDPKNFVPYGAYLANFAGFILAGEGSMNLEGTKVDVHLYTEPAEEPFGLNFYGIQGGGETNSLDMSDGAILNIKIDGEEVVNGGGIALDGIVNVEQSSKINVEMNCQGSVTGIEALRALNVTDSNVLVNVRSTTGGECFGIVCGEASFDLSTSEHSVYSKAENGLALAADTGERGEDIKEYDGSYEAKKIILKNKAIFKKPGSASIALWGVPGYGDTIIAETVFNNADTSKPVDEVLVSVKSANMMTYIAAALVMVFAVGYWLYDSNKRKARKAQLARNRKYKK